MTSPCFKSLAWAFLVLFLLLPTPLWAESSLRSKIEQGEPQVAQAQWQASAERLMELADWFAPLPQRLQAAWQRQRELSQTLRQGALEPQQQKENLRQTKRASQQAWKLSQNKPPAKEKIDWQAVREHLRQAEKAEQASLNWLNRKRAVVALPRSQRAEKELKQALALLQKKDQPPSKKGQEQGQQQRNSPPPNPEKQSKSEKQKGGKPQAQPAKNQEQKARPEEAKQPKKEAEAQLAKILKEQEQAKRNRKKAMGIPLSRPRQPVERDW